MFVFVMSVEARDILLGLGYKLIKCSADGKTWVFENKAGENYSQEYDFPYVVSDVMTF